MKRNRAKKARGIAALTAGVLAVVFTGSGGRASAVPTAGEKEE